MCLYVTIRYCTYLLYIYIELIYQNLTKEFVESLGYSERAYACWQAMIELIFFAPDNLRRQTFYDRVKALEIFWEAEWPRFGEDVCEYI